MKNTVEVKDVITVNTSWTKGNVQHYLVTFISEDKKFLTGIRLFFGEKSYGGNGLLIPEMGYPLTYANVFTGIKTLAMGDVEYSLKTVTDDTYNKIVSSVVAAMKGDYSIQNECYKIHEKKFTITDIFNICNHVNQTVVTEKVEEKKKKEKEVESTKRDNGEAKVEPSVDNINENSIVRFDIDQIEKVSKVVKNPSSSDTVNEVLRNYILSDQKIDYLFEIFEEDGFIAPMTVYKQLYGEEIKKRSNQILMTKDEFIFMSKSRLAIVNGMSLRNRKGEIVIYNMTKNPYLFTVVNHLAKGTKVSNAKNARSKIDLTPVMEYYKEQGGKKLSPKEYAKRYHIPVNSVYNAKKKVMREVSPDNGDKTIYYNILSNVENEKDTRIKLDITKALTHCWNNFNTVSQIAEGYIPKNYSGNTDILQLVALRFLNPSCNIVVSTYWPKLFAKVNPKAVTLIFKSKGFAYKKRIDIMMDLAYLMLNKDKIDWNIAPGEIFDRKEELYQKLYFVLVELGKYDIVREGKVNKKSRIIMGLENLEVPENYIRYFYNINKINKSVEK